MERIMRSLHDRRIDRVVTRIIVAGDRGLACMNVRMRWQRVVHPRSFAASYLEEKMVLRRNVAMYQNEDAGAMRTVA